MGTNPCCAFFATRGSNPDWVKQLQQQPDRVQWEKLSASPFSPRPVSDDEVVCRIAFNPIYWDANTRRLKPTFFDDASNRGASTERLAYATKRAVWRKASAMAALYNKNNPAKHERAAGRLAPLPVSELRSLRYEEQRAIGIYDTALEHGKAHADVCFLIAGKSASRSLRASLFEISGRHRLWRPPELEVLDSVRESVARIWKRITRGKKL